MKPIKKITVGILVMAVCANIFSGCGSDQTDETQTTKDNLASVSVEPENNEANVGEPMPDFHTEDLSGNPVTNEIFSQAELTVVNVWGTFCGPCIEEMPELAEWSNSMSEEVQLIGIVGDINGKEDTNHLELAKEIAEKAGVDFVNLIPTDDFQELLSTIVGYPTTFFVDKAGAVVGEPIIGANVPAYQAFAEDYLNE